MALSASARERMSKPGGLIGKWDMLFLVSCAFAVSVDPLFLYIPVIEEDEKKNKCIGLDSTLKIVAICLRSVTDAIYVANMFLQYLCLKKVGAGTEQGRAEEDSAARQTGEVAESLWGRCCNWITSSGNHLYLGYFVIDILAILPLPQVLIPIVFSIEKGSNLLRIRRLLNAVILLQYVPRVLRIYLSWRKCQRTDCDPISIKLKAAFNFFLYILASYVLGAFWYLFSIELETTCWHKAYQNKNMTTSSFRCGRSYGNYRVLKDYCPEKTENTTSFDFGIFFEAIQSGIVKSTDIPQRILFSFWWGHRNISSLGQNLKTSTRVWENCFAILISVLGLLLLLYFIENLKNYMQWINKSSKNITKTREIKDLEWWISKTKQICKKKPTKIISKVRRRVLEENKDIDMPNLFSCLPLQLKKDIQHLVCSPLLEKMQVLQGKSDKYLKLLSARMQPVLYKKSTYIFRKGDVIDVMLVITDGSILTDTGEGSVEHIKKFEFVGEKLLEWMSSCSASPCVSKLPISDKNVKAITRVEAFALTFRDIEAVFPELSQAASDAGASA